jgi:LacI family transcriptional regulator
MKVTIKDIANVAGVSTATVSRVLNDKDYVSNETKEKVLKVIDDLEYKPDSIARSMITKKTNTIGLLIPDLTNPFYAETSKYIVNIARKHGFSTIICNTEDKVNQEKEYINILSQKRVDGIILGSVRTKEKWLANLENEGLPYITYHRRLQTDDSNFVVSDDEKGIFNAIKHLVELGHKSIGYISGPSYFSTSVERLKGFLKARSHFDLNNDPRLIKDGGYSEKQAWEATKKLLNSPSTPSAILAANDIMALAALDCCLEFDFSVPEDISIMGYDNIPLSSHARIQLTTVSVKPKIMAEKTTELFINKIIEKETEIPIQHVLEPELIVRNTTAHNN